MLCVAVGKGYRCFQMVADSSELLRLGTAHGLLFLGVPKNNSQKKRPQASHRCNQDTLGQRLIQADGAAIDPDHAPVSPGRTDQFQLGTRQEAQIRHPCTGSAVTADPAHLDPAPAAGLAQRHGVGRAGYLAQTAVPAFVTVQIYMRMLSGHGVPPAEFRPLGTPNNDHCQ